MDHKEPGRIGTTTAARAMVDALLREDIDPVFGIPGTQNLAFLDALRDTPQIRFILTRHEQGAAFMAYGFARHTRDGRRRMGLLNNKLPKPERPRKVSQIGSDNGKNRWKKHPNTSQTWPSKTS